MNEDTISIRKFAAKYGLTDTAIRFYIKKEYITSYSIRINPKNDRPGLIEENAIEELRKNFNQEFGLKVKEKPVFEEKTSSLSKVKASKKNSDPNEDTLSGIKIKIEKTKLEKETILLAERKGMLLDREAVDKALYEKGKDVRQKFQSMPARVIDSIIAAALKSRNDALNVLQNAVDEELLKIGEITDYKINR